MTSNWKYVPTHEDIEWARSIVEILQNGGVWVFPAAGLIYHVNKHTRVLTLTNPLDVMFSSDPTFTAAMHHRTCETFKAIGWTVEVNLNEPIA